MHTWENYDEDEYFLKFHRIHPILIYSEKEFDMKKLELQDKMLEALQNKKLSLDEFTQKYKKIMELCKNKNIKKDMLEYELKQEIQKKIEKLINIENEIIVDEFNNILNEIL